MAARVPRTTWPSRLARVGLALALLGACDTAPLFQADALSCGCPCCISDGAPRCVFVSGCANDAECPSGTVCGRFDAALEPAPGKPGIETCRCESPVDPRREGTRCGVPGAFAGRERVLVNGFQVDEFALERLPDQSPVGFEWSPPPEARYVTCALFTCMPDIQAVGDHLEIVNYRQCVAANDVTDLAGIQSEPFIPANIGLEHPPDVDGDDRRCTPDVVRFRDKHTLLAVGCWAYDDAKLVGATRVLELTPSEMADFPTLVRTSCDPPSFAEESTCVTATPGPVELGTCHQGSCMRRCVVAEDCARIPSGCLRGSRGQWECKPIGSIWEYLGVCEENCSQRDLHADPPPGAGAGGGGGQGGS